MGEGDLEGDSPARSRWRISEFHRCGGPGSDPRELSWQLRSSQDSKACVGSLKPLSSEPQHSAVVASGMGSSLRSPPEARQEIQATSRAAPRAVAPRLVNLQSQSIPCGFWWSKTNKR